MEPTRIEYRSWNRRPDLDEDPARFRMIGQSKKLVFGGCRFTVMPSLLGDPRDLEKLDLRNNRLTVLPPQFGDLVSLEKLDLSNNQLSDLPPQFGNLKNLRKLNLSRNLFTAIPQAILDLRPRFSLNIDISNNKITAALPEEIAKIQNLSSLTFDNSAAVPDSLKRISGLQILTWSVQTELRFPRVLTPLPASSRERR